MEINPLSLASGSAAASVGPQLLRIVSGDLAQLQQGVTVAASVLRVQNGEALLNLAGRTLSVRAPIGTNTGDILSIRVGGGQNPTLELLGKSAADAPVSPTVPLTAFSPQPSRVAVVDVLAREPDGTLRVNLEGSETIATSTQTLATGGRYIVQIDRTASGVTLTPVPNSPELATVLASAILRGDPPAALGETAPKLLQELAKLPPETAKQPAVVQTREALEAIVRAPSAEQLRAVVERGGEHYEAKLGRRALGERVSLTNDLKGGVLRLLQTLPEMASALPSARATLDGIETRQAAQVLTHEHGGAFVFQVPILDGEQWNTARLAIEPERRDDSPQSFHVMLHTPMSELGDVWFDAYLDTRPAGSSLRAVLYLADSAGRERLRAELADLRAELQSTGFAAVQVDVQSVAYLNERQKRRMTAITAGLPETVGVLDVRA